MPEKQSTSTINIADKGPGGSELGRASYRAEQVPDAVIIFANGCHPTAGYVDFFEQSPIRIFPPQFILRTIPPLGMVPQVPTPFAIWVMFGASKPIDTVTVHDADGSHEIKVEQVPDRVTTPEPHATWVSGSVIRGDIEALTARAFMGQPTTMATGEEGGGGPTTMATGEEETRIATTMATGEEGSATIGLALTTFAIGEEGPQRSTPFGGF